VFSEAVVEDFYIFEGIASGGGFIEEDLIADVRSLVSAVEGFLSGIFVAVTFGVYASLDAQALRYW